ncbi:porin family protein [Hydrogenophaga laconesensis]|uniref:Outer membrane protein beta-barrel domain-containing protein n=1 Tax=Hydrogenophaga laconesensis TaxID=1805971 RepID=A0ABU1VGT1_9BURK|nr:outer membrane beta-barrel protein [Hydrogenophaga laconesensis]MDR7096685.1 hypothetical protein [Hydrogenophaga laconesensis]
MNKTTLSALAVLAACFALAPAQAQAVNPNMYAEFGYTQYNAKESDSGYTLKFSPAAVTGTIGYQFTPNIAVEGLFGLGAGEGKIKLNGVKVGVKGQVTKAVGVYFKPSIAVSDSIDLFARIGWVHTELEMSVPGASITDSDNGASYGLGANFNISKTSYIQASWMNYYKKDGFKIDGINVAYGFRF